MTKKVLEGVIKKAYFKDKDFVLFLDDSIKALKEFPEDSVDMIFADPPYNLSNGGFTVHAGKRVSVHKGDWDKSKGVEEDFEFHRQWLAECFRVLKPDGSIWVSGTYHSIYQCGYAMQLIGLKILNDISWFKPNASPNLSGRYFTASHETLIWARKDPKGKHTYNYQAMKNGDWHERDFIKKEGKQMRSVWSINTPRPDEKKFGKHPNRLGLNQSW
jgi:site-specific DNA-methyltransferase (adenine-specific)